MAKTALGRGLEGREPVHQRRRVGEVEHPGAAGPPRDQEPDRVLHGAQRDLLDRPRRGVELEPRPAVALDQALDREEEVGPHRLRAEIAAPDPAGDRVHQEQDQGRQDQQAHDVGDLLRPQLDEEEVEPAPVEVDQHRLRRRARAAVPAQERHDVVDGEGDRQDDPLRGTEAPAHGLRLDLAPRLVERAVRRRHHSPGRRLAELLGAALDQGRARPGRGGGLDRPHGFRRGHRRLSSRPGTGARCLRPASGSGH